MTDELPNPKWLILIPTEMERTQVEPQLCIPNSAIEICGFGPVIPAAKTSQLLETHKPDRVLLIGIAGVYDQVLAVGTAFSFSEVSLYGVGAGEGDEFLTAKEMGWNQWDGEERPIGDMISITPLTDNAAQLLTVCSAAGSRDEVELRLNKFPLALAEDMEGFAVASACRLAGVPISIVRGFSNKAGNRDTSSWRITEALQAAVALCHRRIVEKNLGP